MRPARGDAELLYAEAGADGSRPEILLVPAGGSRCPASAETVRQRQHYMHMEGREVFKAAVAKLTELLLRIPERTGVSLDQIKIVIPHQSNIRIVNSALKRADLDVSAAYMNIDRVGNTSAASIPLALTEAVQAGRLTRGDLVLLLAFGGGLTWASALLRY